MGEVQLLEPEKVEGVVMTDTHVLVVYCGYSEWFKTHDLRPLGPFTEEEALEYKSRLEARNLQRRDGDGPITVTVMEMTMVSVEKFSI